MLVHAVEYLANRYKHLPTIKVLHLLMQSRKKGIARPKRCWVLKDLLYLSTESSEDPRHALGYDSSTILLLFKQPKTIQPELAIPVLVELLQLYDSTGFDYGRTLWRQFCASPAPIVWFKYRMKSGCFSASTTLSTKLRPQLGKSAVVVKQDNQQKVKVRPTAKVQAVLADALRRVALP